jgi:hypothetical protein
VVEAIQAKRGPGYGSRTHVAPCLDLHCRCDSGCGSSRFRLRFDAPRQLIAYPGLTPSAQSSGSNVCRGGIAKAGSGLWDFKTKPVFGINLNLIHH